MPRTIRIIPASASLCNYLYVHLVHLITKNIAIEVGGKRIFGGFRQMGDPSPPLFFFQFRAGFFSDQIIDDSILEMTIR